MTAKDTEAPINVGWRCPFADQTIDDALLFAHHAPKPPNLLRKTFFAVLESERYEMDGSVLICKIVDGGVQTIGIKRTVAGRSEVCHWSRIYGGASGF